MTTKTMTTHEVAARFYELAKQGKWFEIQDELFAENVKSVEPENSSYLPYAEGRSAVRKKGEDFVSRITGVDKDEFTAPLVNGNRFVMPRNMIMTVQPHGKIHLDQVQLYEVKDGKIILEQFFYSV